MSTVSNNGTAYAYTTDLPTANFQKVWLGKIGPGVENHSNYGQTFEVGLASGDYVQLYTQISATPQFRLYQAWGSDEPIRASGTYINDWFKFRFERVSNTWTLYIASLTDTVWTTVYSWSQSTAPSSFCYFASYVDLGNYVLPGGSKRSVRTYVSSTHTGTELLDDLDSPTPTLSNLRSAWFDGSTANLAGTDSSGNGFHLTVVGTFVSDSDDPIASSGTTEDVDIEEEFSSTDTQSAAAISLSGSIAESFSADHTPSAAVAAITTTTSDSFANADANSVAVVVVGSVAETQGAATDTQSSATSTPGSITESFALTATPSVSVTAIVVGTADSFSATDSNSSSVAVDATTADSFTPADTNSATSAETVSVSETFSVSDSNSAAVVIAGATSDSFAVDDSQSTAVAAVAVDTTDSSTFTDSNSGVTDGVDSVSVSETFNVTDSNSVSITAISVTTSDSSAAAVVAPSVSVLIVGSTSDSFALTDSIVGSPLVAVVVTEAFAATDTVGGDVATIDGTVSEQFQVTDSVSNTATGTVDVDVAEAFAVDYTVSGFTNTVGLVDVSIDETFSVSDSVSVTVSFSASVAESSSFTDSESTSVIVNAGTVESFLSSAVLSCDIAALELTTFEVVTLQDVVATALNALAASVVETQEFQFTVGGTSYDGLPDDVSFEESFAMVSTFSASYQTAASVTLSVKIRTVAAELLTTVKELK